MNQYEFVRAWKNDASYDIDGPVIVLTLEEVRDFWEAGWNKGYDDSAEWNGGNVKNESPNLKTYLQSKGVNI